MIDERDARTPARPTSFDVFASVDPVTDVIPVITDEPEPPADARRATMLVRIALVAAAVLGLLGIAYVVDVVTSSGEVARGVTVGGIAIGGRSESDAEFLLRQELTARAGAQLQVEAADVPEHVVPSAAGLGVDWPATMSRIGGQPLNPIVRLTSLFGTHEVGVASTVDDAALTRALQDLGGKTDRPAIEGNVVFEGARSVPVQPVAGHRLDIAGAKSTLAGRWALGSPVTLPVAAAEVSVRPDEVERTLRDVATPAVSGDVVFTGKDGTSAVLHPNQVGAVLGFVPDGRGGLSPEVDKDAATGLLAPQLAATEVKPQDAKVSIAGGAPTVTPAVVGDLVAWPKTLDPLPQLLTAAGPRSAAAVYEPAQPRVTTEAANALGIEEVIGDFTTGGFESASGHNIATIAAKVDGALVMPGDTFSLNDFTGPRGTAQGYVESGIIDHGRPQRAVGGGVSQFATTLYNATYFAGLEDVTHTEHSYYISRYPEAREATVFEGAIDLQFRNNSKTGVLIETETTGSTVTVRIWGTKTVDVLSVPGERAKPTQPDTVTLPVGHDCVPAKGAPGFTTSNTRIINDHATGKEIYRHTRTVKYDPVPIVRCE